MGASRKILQELATEQKWRGTTVAYVSRTDYPSWANSCLKLFRTHDDGPTLDELGTVKEIYPGSKTKHFKQIHKDSGIDFADMVSRSTSWDFVAPNSKGTTDYLVTTYFRAHRCSLTTSGATASTWESSV